MMRSSGTVEVVIFAGADAFSTQYNSSTLFAHWYVCSSTISTHNIVVHHLIPIRHGSKTNIGNLRPVWYVRGVDRKLCAGM
jgi:hypothetical protein